VTSPFSGPARLARGRRRADAEGYDITFEVADAEALPYAEGSFDVVLSTFGVMFAPHQAQAAAEMLRVCRRGGRIGLASWTPDGFLGQMLQVVTRYVPPAPGLRSPLLWGAPSRVRELFAGAASMQHTMRTFAFRYKSAEHFVEVFRTFYGPVHKAFASLDGLGQAGFEADLLALLRRADRGGGAGLVVPAEYLETIVTR
jgi:ubiquinone/menaquinone biosynthesis C-methylase UbiE